MASTDRIRNAHMYGNLVRSLIRYPTQGVTVRPGPAGTIEVIGVAWVGGQDVQGVEVSTDGGENFEAAAVLRSQSRVGRLVTVPVRLEQPPTRPAHGRLAGDRRGRTLPAGDDIGSQRGASWYPEQPVPLKQERIREQRLHARIGRGYRRTG